MRVRKRTLGRAKIVRMRMILGRCDSRLCGRPEGASRNHPHADHFGWPLSGPQGRGRRGARKTIRMRTIWGAAWRRAGRLRRPLHRAPVCRARPMACPCAHHSLIATSQHGNELNRLTRGSAARPSPRCEGICSFRRDAHRSCLLELVRDSIRSLSTWYPLLPSFSASTVSGWRSAP
jgi:hypothetical protein